MSAKSIATQVAIGVAVWLIATQIQRRLENKCGCH